MNIGFHLSIKKGIPSLPIHANKLGYSNFQFFTRSSRSWKYKELDENLVKQFKVNCDLLGFKTKVIHLPYLPNFATDEKEMRAKSLDSLITESRRADLLGVNFLVIHQFSPSSGLVSGSVLKDRDPPDYRGCSLAHPAYSARSWRLISILVRRQIRATFNNVFVLMAKVYTAFSIPCKVQKMYRVQFVIDGVIYSMLLR